MSVVGTFFHGAGQRESERDQLLVHDFTSDNSLPTGFSLDSGSEIYSEAGLVLDGSQYFSKAIDGTESYIDFSKPSFLLVVFNPAELPAVDQWLASFNNGSTSTPQIAMRVYRNSGGGTNTPRMFVYPGSGDTTSSYGELKAQLGVPMFAALTWTSGTSATIYTDDNGITGTTDTIGTVVNDGTLDVLTFCDDHNGGAEFDGTILKIAVGWSDDELSVGDVVRLSYINGDVPILVEGQSFQSQIFDSADTGAPVGHQSAMLEASKHLDLKNKIYVIDGSNTGSALLTSSSASDAWLDNSGDSIVADQRQLDSENKVVTQGLPPKAVWWAQFQGDVFDIASETTTIEDYEAGLEWKIARNDELYDNPVQLLEIPCGRNEAVTDAVDEAHQSLRETYIDVVNNSSSNVLRMEGYDIPYYDTTGHPTDAGQVTRCARAMRVIMQALGYIDENGVSYGPNLSTKGAFSIGTGWSESDFMVTGTAATGFLTDLTAAVEADETYEVTLPITEYTSGSVRVLLYDSNKVGTGTARSSADTHVEEITISGATGTATTYATIQVTSDFTGVIDLNNFRIRKKQTQSVDGPAVTSASATGSTITLNITHDQGTDINNPTSFEGFKVFDPEGTELSVTNVTRSDADTVAINMASSLTDLSVTVKYPYGALEGVTQTNCVIDNSTESMPLQSFVRTIAVT